MFSQCCLKLLECERATVCVVSIFDECSCQFIKLIFTEVKSTFTHTRLEHSTQIIKIHMPIAFVQLILVNCNVVLPNPSLDYTVKNEELF